MHRIVFLLFFSLLASSLSAQDTTTLRFTMQYRGKNIYVQNPYYKDSLFCTCQVKVNGQIKFNSPDRSSYEIDLAGFHPNDTIRVEIVHYKSCLPKVLNQHIGHNRPVVFGDIKISDDSVHCYYKKGTKVGTICIEHFEYNEWVCKKTLEVKEVPDSDTLVSVAVYPFSGMNKYRMKYVSTRDGTVSYSVHQEWTSSLPPVKIEINEQTALITFSRPAEYMVLDEYGTLKQSSYAKEADLQKMMNGTFYLNVDGKTKKFKLRHRNVK